MSQKRRKNKSNDLVLEIGIEELPAPYFDCIYEQEEKVKDFIKSHNLTFHAMRVYITPRRIIFHVLGLDPVQGKQEELIKGPSYDKCYDAAGAPTPALMGFLKSKGARKADLVEIRDERRHCLGIKKISGGKKTSQILAEILPQILNLFSFPRNMGWNELPVRFPRPIRWVLCLYGTQVIPVTIAGLKASRVTCGHRYIAPGKLSIKNTADFFAKLKLKKVIYDENARIQVIERDLCKEARRLKLQSTAFDKDLIYTVARLTENPFIVSGTFKKEYLKLPADVLSTCMKKHQKIFACYNARGILTPIFIAVLDGKRSGLNRIQQGYENVLESRLRDASFFLKEDLESGEPFGAQADTKLKEVIFLGTLGTFDDKRKRLRELSDYVSGIAAFHNDQTLNQQDRTFLLESAHYCKSDLVTHMVYEFPELQGIVGREYLKREGKPEEIYQAVSDHYLPKTLSDDIDIAKYSKPAVGWISALLGIVDRLDTIVGALGSGIEISGSEDPYALRRASGSMVKIIRAFNIKFSLDALIKKACDLYGGQLTVPSHTLREKVLNLIKERIIYEAQNASGSLERMILEGVLASSFDDVCDAFLRYDVLTHMASDKRKKDLFQKAFKVVERTSNILKPTKGKLAGTVDKNLFQEDLERAVFCAYEENKNNIVRIIQDAEYEAATNLYAETFFEKLHQFFDNVLVNVDDERIRNNRLLLMKGINELFTKEVADLSVIQGMNVVV